MSKQLSFIIFKTFFFSSILGIFALYLFLTNQPVDRNRMRCDMSGIAFALYIAYQLYLILLSLLAFLNLKKNIFFNFKHSFLSFFGLHIISLIYLLLIAPLLYSQEALPFLIASIPYLSFFYYYFIQFRKELIKKQ